MMKMLGRQDTMSADKILVDTSVWIDYFRGKSSKTTAKLDDLLSHGTIYVPKIILAELIQGARSKKEISIIHDFLDAFFIIDQKEDSWIKAGHISYDLKKRGMNVHLFDCYIAVIAREYECKIFTQNRHFKEIQKVLQIDLVES